MTLVAVSVVIGLVGAICRHATVEAVFSLEVGAADPFTFALIILVIAIVAFLASWLPARRAARVNPIVALRAD